MDQPTPVPPVPPPLSFNLGPSDIANIVDALLPPLAPFLKQFTPDQQYVGLYTAVSKIALNKTFSNNDQLAALVQLISNQVIELATANPDCSNSCPYGYYTGTCLCYAPCC